MRSCRRQYRYVILNAPAGGSSSACVRALDRPFRLLPPSLGLPWRAMGRLIARAALAVIPLLAACSSGPKPASPPRPAGSASSAPMTFSPSSALSPFDAEFKAGACSITLNASPGSTYVPAETDRDRAVEMLRSSLTSCYQRTAGVQGTLYVSADVDQAGQLVSVIPTPGGAIATDVATCVGSQLSKVRLPPPARGPAALLVLVVSSCNR